VAVRVRLPLRLSIQFCLLLLIIFYFWKCRKKSGLVRIKITAIGLVEALVTRQTRATRTLAYLINSLAVKKQNRQAIAMKADY
jgi:hypothetical protein